MVNFSLIVTAGGTSSRFGNSNKLLELINERPVIEYTVNKFINFDNIKQIIIPANISIQEELKSLFDNNKKIKIVLGGNTRQESVYKGLQFVDTEFVIIHDGARPLIDNKTINSVMLEVERHNAVSVMTKTTDTIKEVDETGKIIRTIERSYLFNTQTPQAFRTAVIKEAHEKLKDKNYTDDASLLEELGIPVYSVIGEYTNIKITTKSDLDFAKIYI